MKARCRGGRALRGWPAGRGMGCWVAVVLAMGALWIAPVAAQDLDWEGLSARFPFGASLGHLPTSGSQTAPSIACDTTLSGESWVVWEDHRLGDPDIFAARVSVEGALLDSSGLPIAVGPDRQTTPRVAAGGGVFLAVWQATDPTRSAWRLEGVRFGPDGSTLDPTPVLITESDYELQDLDLAFGAASFMVIWSDTLGGRIATHGARVSTDGAVLDEEGLVLNSENGYWSFFQAVPASAGMFRATRGCGPLARRLISTDAWLAGSAISTARIQKVARRTSPLSRAASTGAETWTGEDLSGFLVT